VVAGLRLFAAVRAGETLFDLVHAATGGPSGSPAGEHVYRLLWIKIVDGELSPLSVLHEADIAQLAGVSRVPVREALARLKSEGFIVRQGRRIRVRAYTASDIEALYDCRCLLETAVAERAGPRVPPRVVADLRRELRHVAAGSLVSAAWLRADLHLHQVLVDHCGNEYLAEATRRVRRQMSMFLPYGLLSEDNLTASREEHEAIVSELATRAGRPAAAMERHIVQSKSRLLAILRQHGFLGP
jgi:DNA-binding GntR family transcriptional regulator